MSTSAISFQGVSSGLQTDALINAIIAQDSQGQQRLKDRQTQNTSRSTALESMATSMKTLTISMAKLYDSFSSRAITSTDSNGTYVTATGSGAANGSYDVKVSQVATKGQLSPKLDANGNPQTLAVADPNATGAIAGDGTYTVTGTDGVTKSFTVTTTSLYGLRDAINGSGAGVTASVINTGKGGNQYQLVVTANTTGTGSTKGIVTLAATGNTTDTLGISGAGSGGLTSAASGVVAQNALFSVDGIQLERQSNTVTDAVDGITFTLKKGSTDNETVLTVAADKTAATSALQDVLTQYNSILTTYKTNTAVTKDTSDTTDSNAVTSGPLANDSVARSVITQLRTALTGTADGMSSSATFNSIAQLGVTIASDGTLSLDTTKFQAALDKDPNAVANVFELSGSSTSAAVSFAGASAGTATGAVDFNLTYGSGGAVSGSLTYNGTTYSGLTGTNGVLSGPSGTPLAGLALNVTASGTGTITVSRGVGQKLQDVISDLTSYSGSLETTRSSLDAQNLQLGQQIDADQDILDKRKAALQTEYDNMESSIAQLKSLSSSLSSS